jgi:2-oxoglutarate dehydrogenase E2 component (dihydrolipoamide succinyltransferase)
MKIEIKVPPLGESVSEAIVSRILVENGAIIAQDLEILELETDKVNQVLYAPASGKVEITVKIEDAVKVGQVIGTIDSSFAGDLQAPKPKEPSAQQQAPAPTPIKDSIALAAGGARQASDTFFADIVKPIQEAAPTLAKPQEKALSRKKMSSLRKTIASRLVEVKNQTAMLTTFNEVDMSAVMAIRSREKDTFMKKYGVKLGFMSFFVKAVVSALKAVPEVNAYILGEEIITFASYDIGVAVSTDKGLVVPVIRSCDTLSFGDIEKQIELYAKKAREGSIGIDAMRGGSFTITNGGVFGSLLSTPILNPPQSAILGMHTIQQRPIAEDNEVVIRPMMYLALSYDHRIIDGRQAVEFLVHIKKSLEDPAKLLLDL